MAGERRLDGGDLAVAGRHRRRPCRARPNRRVAAVERRIDRRRDGGVADAHLADASRSVPPAIASMPKAMVATQAFSSMAGVLGDVARRHVEREVEHLEAEAEARADLVDRRAAGGEIVDHLAVDRGGIGRHAAGDDAVAAGEDAHQRAGRPTAAPCPARRRAIRPAPPDGRGCRRAWSGRVALRAPRRPHRASGPGMAAIRRRMSSKGWLKAEAVMRNSFEKIRRSGL